MKVTIRKAALGENEVIHSNKDLVINNVTLVNIVKNNKYIGITNKQFSCFDPILCDITRFTVTIEND